jgi:hypothetical protein
MDDKRRRSRTKAVLPVRVCSNDGSGNSHSELVHTLDITDTGARLGGVRHPLKVGSLITLQYKQHKASFRVVWTEAVPGRTEHRVGLEALAYKDVWGLGADLRAHAKAQPIEQPGEPLEV